MPYYFIHSSPNTLLMEVLLQTCFSDQEMVTQERLNTSLQGTDLVLGSARLSVHPGRVALLPASLVMGRQMGMLVSPLCLAFALLLVHDSGVVGALSLPGAWISDFSVGTSGLGFYGA